MNKKNRRAIQVAAILVGLALSSSAFADSKTVKIASGKAPNEHRFCSKHRKVESKNCHFAANVTFKYPGMRDAEKAIQQCAMAAAGAAVSAGVIASPAAGLAAFKPVFITCLKAKIPALAHKISMSIHVNKTCTRWSRH